MNNRELLLESLREIEEKYPTYYNKIIETIGDYNSEDIDEYIQNVFYSKTRAFFTISSKESFNNLESEKDWNKSIIFEPLNDHSRVFMHKGDIVFCYRQGQFDDLNDALNMRGIYGVGIVVTEPEKLYEDKERDYQNYGVCIIFPFSLRKHLELRNIQLNPITISLTPYNGNRNDALQHIQDKQQYNELIKMVCKKNPELKEHFEKVLNITIPLEMLPSEYWSIKSNKEKDNNSTRTPLQTIYYGVPGSGKSHKIDELTKNLSEEQVIRVVFHPEYTNADFVGQILPILNQETGNFEYKFSPGPFSQILRRAYLNPSKKYYLIVEEINRGNAAAIFGDLFQLLDRLEKGQNQKIGKNTYTEGWSSYFINNDYINWYIREFADSTQYKDVENSVTIPEENKKKDKNYEKYSTVNIEDITFVSNTGIRLPPNLSILATMNTSDQNVFTLDNAFQRRWDMELVENVYIHDDSSEEDKANAEIQRNAKITAQNKTITWENFQTEINKIIAEKGNESGFSSMEDKRLGCWFIKNEDGEIDSEKFANKVLKYLWDDAFKFNRNDIFGDIKNFEELKNSFMNINGFAIFKDVTFSFEAEATNDNQPDSTEQSEKTEQIEETQES